MILPQIVLIKCNWGFGKFQSYSPDNDYCFYPSTITNVIIFLKLDNINPNFRTKGKTILKRPQRKRTRTICPYYAISRKGFRDCEKSNQ